MTDYKIKGISPKNSFEFSLEYKDHHMPELGLRILLNNKTIGFIQDSCYDNKIEIKILEYFIDKSDSEFWSY